MRQRREKPWWVKFDGADDSWIYFQASSDSGQEPYHIRIIRDVRHELAGTIYCECMDRSCRHHEGHILFRNKKTCKHIARVWQLIDRNRIRLLIDDNKAKRKQQRHELKQSGSNRKTHKGPRKENDNNREINRELQRSGR